MMSLTLENHVYGTKFRGGRVNAGRAPDISESIPIIFRSWASKAQAEL